MHHFDHIVASLCFERDGVNLPIFSRLFAGHKVVMSSVRIQVINPNTSPAMTRNDKRRRVRSPRRAPDPCGLSPRRGAVN